jgi:microcystin-dependent protein
MLVYGDLIAAGLEELASDPTTGLFSGRMYRNTTTGEMKVYTGSIWKIVSDLDSVQALANKAISNSTASDVDVRFPTAGSTSKELQVPRLTTTERLSLSSPTTGRVVFDTTLSSLFVYNGSTWAPAGGGATLKATITKPGHGLTDSDAGSPLYLSGSDYVKARADAANTAEVVGLFESKIDDNTFILAMAGDVTVDVSVSGAALVPGETYFLSPSSAGKITATEPTVVGQISKPIGIAKTASTLEFINMRGAVVGGANVRTTIPLAQTTTNTVQNVSAYEAGELTGWVSIEATPPVKFYVQAQFSKNGAGTGYNLSYQLSGDNPPSGMSLAVTNAGVIQLVMPTIAGFGSASISFSLNAPAVGVTLPLSLDANLIVGDTNPVGTLLDFAGTTAPSGYLMCDGRQLSTAGAYERLFAVIGYSYGGSGANFNIPDFRGRFARYNDNMGTGAAGRDTASRNADKSQGQATAKNGLSNSSSSVSASGTSGDGGNHSHEFRAGQGTAGTTYLGWNLYGGAFANYTAGRADNIQLAGTHTHSLSVSGTAVAQTITGDSETRPINLSCNKIIKF